MFPRLLYIAANRTGFGALPFITLHISKTPFHLNNILHCPYVSANLLSVHRFSKDNNCYFEFHSHGFYVKEKCTGKTLFQGRSENDLYPLVASHINKSSHPLALLGERVAASIWHHRLGHPAASILQRLLASQSLYVFGSINKLPFC